MTIYECRQSWCAVFDGHQYPAKFFSATFGTHHALLQTMRIAFACPLFVLMGCSASLGRATKLPPSAASQPATRPANPLPHADAAILELRRAAHRLECFGSDARHGREARALGLLAMSTKLVAPTASTVVAQEALHLRTAMPESTEAIQFVTRASDSVIAALELGTFLPHSQHEELARLRSAVDTHDSLARQSAPIGTLLVALAGAIHLSMGWGELEAPMPCGVAAVGLVPQLRKHVGMLAVARESEAPGALADLVDALAEAAQALAMQPTHSHHEVSTIRRWGVLIRRAHAPLGSLTHYAQQALQNAVQVLRAQTSNDAENVWIASAERAVAAIDRNEMLPFQRIRLQDAARATVDAYGLLLASPARLQETP